MSKCRVNRGSFFSGSLSLDLFARSSALEDLRGGWDFIFDRDIDPLLFACPSFLDVSITTRGTTRTLKKTKRNK